MFRELCKFSVLSRNRTNLVLDTRTIGKVDAGKIHAKKFWLSTPSSDAKTVFELDLNQFHQQFQLAKPRKDDKIIFYCTPGTPSTDAANRLEALGYTNINYSDGSVDSGSYPNCDEKEILVKSF